MGEAQRVCVVAMRVAAPALLARPFFFRRPSLPGVCTGAQSTYSCMTALRAAVGVPPPFTKTHLPMKRPTVAAAPAASAARRDRGRGGAGTAPRGAVIPAVGLATQVVVRGRIVERARVWGPCEKKRNEK